MITNQISWWAEQIIKGGPGSGIRGHRTGKKPGEENNISTAEGRFKEYSNIAKLINGKIDGKTNAVDRKDNKETLINTNKPFKEVNSILSKVGFTKHPGIVGLAVGLWKAGKGRGEGIEATGDKRLFGNGKIKLSYVPPINY